MDLHRVRGRARFIPALSMSDVDVMVLVLIPLWAFVIWRFFA